jgi:hypothetical protein
MIMIGRSFRRSAAEGAAYDREVGADDPDHLPLADLAAARLVLAALTTRRIFAALACALALWGNDGCGKKRRRSPRSIRFFLA